MYTIRSLFGCDLDNGSFFETLEALAEVNLTPDKAKQIYRKRLCASPTNITLVAEDDGKIIGTGSIFIERKYIHGGSYVGHIEDVAIHPLHQNKDIGTALVKELIEEG